ncbi:sodium:solute symporter family transporter [Thermogemmata fonticola]|jgi:SSS family transporter|uniref:Sodium/solute symporter n=1 Tax=Thermogemmata fonticola TaxID=2755323 RepID=A0A7V8VFA2_9BACT|nr:sodium/solute symporter [Thermogemmata fonticola]MBA2226965.1 sodium/solute symporter [Thermogemmata fonticola]
MSTLSWWDGAVVVAYAAATLGVGLSFGRRQQSSQQYFLGGRRFPAVLLLISIVATETSTVTFLSVPGLAYRAGGNLTFLQLALGLILGRMVVAWLLVPLYFTGQFISAYEVLQTRFGPAVQRGAAGLFLVTRTLADGLRLFLTALLLQHLAGWELVPSILVLSVATLLYTGLGGMRAVVWTDVLQWCIYIGGAVLALGLLLAEAEGGLGGWSATAASAGKLQLWDVRWDWREPYTLWAGILGGAFLTMGTHGADQLTVQRLLCAGSVRAARWALIGSGLVVAVQFGLFLLIGVSLAVVQQQGRWEVPAAVAERADAVFGYYIVHGLPVGVVGLLVAAVLAAAMSTLSSSLNSSAGVVVRDFYRGWFGHLSEEEQVRIGRRATVACGVCQAAVAIGAAHYLERSVVDAALSITGWTTGGILGLFLLGCRRRVPRASAALLGLLAGLAVVAATWWSTTLAWPWWAPLGTLTTVAVALLADRWGNPRPAPRH